jgi:hypothetical protein
MITKRLSDEVLEVKIEQKNFSIVWISDLHKDSEFSMWKHVKKYLDDNPNAYIVIGGDSIDVMQFVNDKRGSKTATLEKFNSSDYANKVIEDSRKDIILPYKDRIISWNRGNHDNSIVKHHNIDLLALICGVDVPIHEYTGYIILNTPVGLRNKRTRLVIHFCHSPFSMGTRSKGSLGIDISKATYPSADIWITEHTHDGFIHPVRHEVLCQNNTLEQRNKWYIQNIAAKQETQGKRNGFHFETNKGNRASGIVELHFIEDTHNEKLKCNKVNHILF